MKDLMRKLLRKSEVEVTFEEGMDFFRANGVDLTCLNFPDSRYQNSMTISRDWCGFSGLKAQLYKKGENPAHTVITGKYHTQEGASSRNELLDRHPGTHVIANFSIENNTLSISQ